MKKVLSLLFITFALTIIAGAQPNKSQRKDVPVLKEVSGLEVVKSVYPEAVAVEKFKGDWFNIVSADKKVLGYCLSSKPYSDGIKGYNNTTPVIVITDKNKTIKKVAILSNWETAAYLKKLERQKFFNNWDGMKVSEAANKKATPDSYSGATFSATAISKNVEIILKKAAQK